MIELPEAITLAKQINACLVGKTLKAVLPPTKLHKFCWFNGDPLDYESLIISSKIVSGSAFGIFVEIAFDNGQKLCFDDGVIIRYHDKGDIPKDYQLAIQFSDGSAVAFTVAMYGGIASLIMWNDNMTFITAVIYFCFMALDVLLLCFELIMLTFFDKKTYGDD